MAFWEAVWNKVARPEVDPAEIERHLAEVRKSLPTPLFWLLGKTQSGKSSLVRAITGAGDAEVGNGFRPCTRTARIYEFPAADDCLLRFLDTRGLGEVAYDPAEDIAQFAGQAHLLVVVLKGMDLAQEHVVATARQLVAARPDWPVLVVQTCLHEGYAQPGDRHAVPYPFNGDPPWDGVPTDLARALTAQREWFADFPWSDRARQLRFVPVDLTLPDDGYSPVDYGLDAVWTAIEELLPCGLRVLLGQSPESSGALKAMHRREAENHVIGYALAAGAAAAIPVPWIDLPLVFGLQTKMFHAVAGVYRQPMTGERMKEILALLGMGGLSRVLGLAGRELAKGIPAVGSAAAGLYNGAVTYAMGMTLIAYFERVRGGAIPDPQDFQSLYNEQLEVGRTRLRTYLENLRPWRRDGDAAASESANRPGAGDTP